MAGGNGHLVYSPAQNALEELAVRMGWKGRDMFDGMNQNPIGSQANPVSSDVFPAGQAQEGLAQVFQQLPGLFQQGAAGVTQGIQNGFLPANMDRIEAGLRPSLNRSFEQGAASIREQNALTGNLSGSGASTQIGNYRGDLENGLMSNLANVYGGALPASISAQSGLSNMLFNAVPGMQTGAIGNALQLQQQNRQYPLQLMQLGFGGGAGSQSVFQPGNPSLWPNLINGAATTSAAFLGGK